jgi:ribonuclease BN (tRNA processing enzyme)
MELAILGSGTCSPNPARMAPGYFLSIGSARILIDPGPGAVGRAVALGLDPYEAEALALTHNHLDHSADILPFLFSRKNCVRGGYMGDVRIFAPRGFGAEFAKLMEVYGRHIVSEKHKIIIEEMGADEWEGPSFSIRSTLVLHSGSAVGYKFSKAGGPSLAYSGDTGYCEEIVELARGADILLIECSYPDGTVADGHMTPSGVAAVAIQSGAKHLVITHMQPELDPVEAVRVIRAAGYKGEVTVAEDGMRIRA